MHFSAQRTKYVLQTIIVHNPPPRQAPETQPPFPPAPVMEPMVVNIFYSAFVFLRFMLDGGTLDESQRHVGWIPAKNMLSKS